MLARKDKIVDKSTAGVAFLFRKNKVDSKLGFGRFVRLVKLCAGGGERKEREKSRRAS